MFTGSSCGLARRLLQLLQLRLPKRVEIIRTWGGQRDAVRLRHRTRGCPAFLAIRRLPAEHHQHRPRRVQPGFQSGGGVRKIEITLPGFRQLALQQLVMHRRRSRLVLPFNPPVHRVADLIDAAGPVRRHDQLLGLTEVRRLKGRDNPEKDPKISQTHDRMMGHRLLFAQRRYDGSTPDMTAARIPLRNRPENRESGSTQQDRQRLGADFHEERHHNHTAK